MEETAGENPAVMERYQALVHAMQSGVKMLMELEGVTRETSPKHLRVGVNNAMADQGSLVRVLIAKGVLTQAEYEAAIVEGMAREVADYERRISELTGATITLA